MDANPRAFVYVASAHVRSEQLRGFPLSEAGWWHEEWDVLVGDLAFKKSQPQMDANEREWTQTHTELCTLQARC